MTGVFFSYFNNKQIIFVKAQAETLNQQAVIQQLNQQLENMEAVLQHLRDEHEQTTIKLHEERK